MASVHCLAARAVSKKVILSVTQQRKVDILGFSFFNYEAEAGERILPLTERNKVCDTEK